MKTYLSDRARIELAMPIVAIQDIGQQSLHGASTDVERNEAIALGGDCVRALKAALDTGHQKKTHALAKRAHRTYREIVKPYNDPGSDLKLYGLAIYHMLATMIDQDFLSLGSDDDFKRVLDRFLPAITPDEATAHYDHAKARFGAHELFTLAKAQGLYEGVDIDGLVKAEH